MFTCYKIINSINNKLYIGVTHLTIEKRLLHHFYEVRHGTVTVLYRAIRKYGEDKFKIFEIEKHDTIEGIWEAEKKYIKEYDTFFRNGKGYNMTTGGDGVPNYVMTEETRNKHRLNALSDKCPLRTPEARRKNGLARKGNKHYTHKLSVEKRKEKILYMETPEAVAKRAGKNHYRAKEGWKFDEKVRLKQAETCRKLKIDRAAVRNECLALMKLYNIHLDLPSHGNSGSIEYWTKKIFQIQLLKSNLSIS